MCVSSFLAIFALVSAISIFSHFAKLSHYASCAAFDRTVIWFMSSADGNAAFNHFVLVLILLERCCGSFGQLHAVGHAVYRAFGHRFQFVFFKRSAKLRG